MERFKSYSGVILLGVNLSPPFVAGLRHLNSFVDQRAN